jgi:hypothetical protein
VAVTVKKLGLNCDQVVVAAGKTATLECRVQNLGDRTVRKFQSNLNFFLKTFVLIPSVLTKFVIKTFVLTNFIITYFVLTNFLLKTFVLTTFDNFSSSKCYSNNVC